jgi:CDP-4-dehydro-6-deoxyglucose reductase
VSEASPQWQGRSGFVHKAVLDDFPSLKNVTVYACGSPSMIHAVLDDFVLHGLDENDFYSDVLDYVPTKL